MTSPTEDDNPISAYTRLPGLHRTMKVGGGPIGSTMTVIIEGHDISHLCRGVNVNAHVGEAITVDLELIGIELVLDK